MKTRLILIAYLFTAVVLMTNCSGSKKEETTTHEHTSDSSASSTPVQPSKPQFEVDATFKQQLTNVYTSYLSLKEAFVSSDADKVRSESITTKQSVASVDMKLLTGAAHNDWMNYQASIESSLNDIAAVNEIEIQRKAFSTLSDNLYKSIKAFGLSGKEAYYEFCPMAFNNEGAYWLSDQKQIRNPYFGDKMLTCGVVKEQL